MKKIIRFLRLKWKCILTVIGTGILVFGKLIVAAGIIALLKLFWKDCPLSEKQVGIILITIIFSILVLRVVISHKGNLKEFLKGEIKNLGKCFKEDKKKE